MSRIEKLKVLLARVEQRRAEPRLIAVSNAGALPSANTNVAAARALELAPTARSRPEEPRASTPAPLQEAFAPTAPSSIPPPPPSTRSSSLPPMTRTPLPPPPSAAHSSSNSSVPPASNEPLSRANTEVLPAAQVPAAPTRIAPTPVTSTEPAVVATSAARIEAPKTFGELLERSLALRPKSG